MIPRTSPPMFSAERLHVIGVLIDLMKDTEHWDKPDASWRLFRNAIEVYVWRCIDAGFCKTDDQVRLCAQRYIAGKRKVTPPGTKRRQVLEARMREALAKVPPELAAAVEAALAEQPKAVAQYKSGVEKALNSLVGSVMKRHKADPALVKQLLAKQINS